MKKLTLLSKIPIGQHFNDGTYNFIKFIDPTATYGQTDTIVACSLKTYEIVRFSSDTEVYEGYIENFVEINFSEGDFIWNIKDKKKGVFHKNIDGNSFISYSGGLVSFDVDYSIIEKYIYQDNLQMFSLKSKVLHSFTRIVMTTGDVKEDRFEGINLLTGEKTYFLMNEKWLDITNDYHMTLAKFF